ncbi:hypothetical protein AAKU55_004873 [Oxalobacteraceae bacterium GrIS 1.11]
MKAQYGFLMACSLACAAALASPSERTGMAPQREHGVSYLCGGIGSSEAAQMKREASNYNLMLTFAENTGAYLADVNVAISDLRGKEVLQTTCDGPILLVKFPRAGSYRVKAEINGHAINKVVQVDRSSRGAAVALLWPRRLIERG